MKMILKAVIVTALLASPAMARTVHRQHAAPLDPRGTRIDRGPYTPDLPVQPGGFNRDFQDGSRGYKSIYRRR
jgi:hypothetical protein